MERILQVSEVNRYLRALLDSDPILNEVWVEGEVANFKAHPSGHLYFSLRDREGSLRAVMFRSRVRDLPFRPQDGQRVLARGRIGVFEQGGIYQLYAEELKAVGAGEAYLAYVALKAKLEIEGLFAPARKRPLPALPRRVGVITARQGAALRDILSVGRRRYPGLAFLVIPALVQGEEAPAAIIRALELMNQQAVDVVILGRGGGSTEDLAAFNQEEVVRAVAACRVPVVAAVGHETDFTLVDFAADRRAATPSQAAELVVPERGELDRQLVIWQRRLASALARRGESAFLRLGSLRARLFREPRNQIDRRRQLIDVEAGRLGRAGMSLLERRSGRLGEMRGRLLALGPAGVLARGYAILERYPTGEALARAGDLKVGDRFLVRLADGSWRAAAEEREP